MTVFRTGQKWISNAEPELGMGRVTAQSGRTLTLYFDAVEQERTYASQQAPLTRVRFNVGDEIVARDGVRIIVTSVLEQNDLLVYQGDYGGTSTAIMETDLDSNIRFSKPEDRLFTRQIDENHWFDLRYRARRHLARLAGSASRGLYGPRVAPVPHQLYIAAEVSRRFAPRVLLADEVGLGKTIEAGLIIHQQLISGRAGRVLVIVPPALTFQWFVEMIRRFNLQFAILDEERCLQIAADNQEEGETEAPFNPFEAQQLVLCSLDLFLDNPARVDEAFAAEWDLVVVDEAHHLHWSPEAPSPAYQVVEHISRASPGLLLLTATPEQLGVAGHFARLRLLDPSRFHDLDDFLAEERQFEQVANVVNDLLSGDEESAATARQSIAAMLGAPSDTDDDTLVQSLLDRHGTGRVLFRNVRSSVSGFPSRQARPVTLASKTEKFDWLISLLQAHPAEKFLLICGSQTTAIEVVKRIESQTAIRVALFHESMDLIARDRAAAYFADTDRGAQILVSSEIGSEGRNFQFAHHLVLFDLPTNPDLLEQRIGRLDRIGQQQDVQIHVPCVSGSDMDYRQQWYEQGLDAFSRPNPVAQGVYDELRDELEAAIANKDITAVLDRTRSLNRQRLEAVNRGRDRLLEMNSHRPAVSARIVEDIAHHEGGAELERYMELSFDAWGLESELLNDEVFLVRPTEGMMRHQSTSLETLDRFHFPELPEDGVRYSYHRETALAREDVQFFTFEHPMVQQALDSAISDTRGNAAMIAVKHPQLPAGTLLVETIHIIESLAPISLGVDHFLPPAVLRDLIAPNLASVTAQLEYTDFRDVMIDVQFSSLAPLLESQRDGIHKMLAQAAKNAAESLAVISEQARADAARRIDNELARLRALQAVNPSIRPEEIEYREATRDLVLEAIDQADVRLDAIRVIVAG